MPDLCATTTCQRFDNPPFGDRITAVEHVPWDINSSHCTSDLTGAFRGMCAARTVLNDAPVLADAAEEAGCTDIDLLNRLRSGGLPFGRSTEGTLRNVFRLVTTLSDSTRDQAAAEVVSILFGYQELGPWQAEFILPSEPHRLDAIFGLDIVSRELWGLGGPLFSMNILHEFADGQGTKEACKPFEGKRVHLELLGCADSRPDLYLPPSDQASRLALEGLRHCPVQIAALWHVLRGFSSGVGVFSEPYDPVQALEGPLVPWPNFPLNAYLNSSWGSLSEKPCVVIRVAPSSA